MDLPATMSSPRAFSSESSVGAAADTFSPVASSTSTPPTTTADTMSLASENSKHENAAAIGPIDDTIDALDVDASSVIADSIVASAPTTLPTLPTLPNASQLPSPNALDATPSISSGRSRRQRLSAPIYNIAKLAGTAIHGKRRAKGDDVADRKRRATTGGDARIESEDEEESNPLSITQSAGPIATKNSKSFKETDGELVRRIRTRSSAVEPDSLAQKLSTLGKKGRTTFEKGLTKMSRELRRLQDTDEFAFIDKKPVIVSTWANGKPVLPDNERTNNTAGATTTSNSSRHSNQNATPSRGSLKRSRSNPQSESSRKKAKGTAEARDEEDESEDDIIEEQAPPPPPRVTKKYLDRGLYAGQETPADVYQGLTAAEKKKLAELPELMPSGRPNTTMPLPMFNGMRTLIEGRDFKLPWDVCNPLPPGQPKPDFKKLTKNRFIGDAAAYWKKTPHFKDYQSKCVCAPEDGCGESCQNRIMLYECDDNNCNVGPQLCQNRAFARLQERTKLGGKYRVGVEVLKTEDRGYGIRANRPFEANQIIMEYIGEIITEEECDRRMNEKYQNAECYYLMSFDQNMIIDATTGSIARFVNHSCSPNCRMIKWIVSGQPRMALFAGDRDIMTGEELTYDYNFDPFSAKNVQKCLCGSANCRGVLGPKPKEVKQPKQPKDDAAAAGKKGASKRKRNSGEADEDDEEVASSKKRKIIAPTGTKAKQGKTLTKASIGAIKGAVASIKSTASTISVNTKAILGSKSSGRKTAAIQKSKTVVRTYSKTKVSKRPLTTLRTTPRQATARASGSATIVAASSEKA